MSMVEWKKLGDVCEILDYRRKPISKDIRKGGVFPYYGANGIQDYIDDYIFDGTFLLLGEDGSVINEDKSPILHWATGKIWVNNHAHVLAETDKSKMRYIYYSLQCQDVSGIVRGTPPKINQANLRNIQIPIPSLSEQNRIVGILDTFTASIDNLKQQIEQRRKQYEYLIDFFFGGSLVKMKQLADDGVFKLETLAQHGSFTRGRRFVRTDIIEEGQPCIHYGDMYTFYGLSATKANTHLPVDFPKKMRYAKKGDVVIVGAGENNEDIGVGLVWLGDEPAAVHDACYIYENDLNPMFVSYFLRSRIYHLQIKSHVVRGKICSISSDGIGKALIPVYPMEQQQIIVQKLLPFEKLLDNLEQQLAQRQKQYEYYRNKLLTFE